MIYVLASLATYYAALTISREDGPFAAFLWLRNRFTADTWLARGVRCLVCVSCYTALAATLWLIGSGRVALADAPIVWLGLAGASVVLDKYWRR